MKRRIIWLKEEWRKRRATARKSRATASRATARVAPTSRYVGAGLAPIDSNKMGEGVVKGEQKKENPFKTS